MFLFKCISNKLSVLLKSFSLLFLFSVPTSCFHYYYKAQKEPYFSAEKFTELKNQNKFFILHSGKLAYELSNSSVDSSYLNGIPKLLPTSRDGYLNTKPTGVTRYKKRKKADQSYILEEVHIYAYYPVISNLRVKIPLKDIYNVEIYQPAKGATATSMIGGIVGIATSALLVGGIISAATYTAPAPSGSSCPFIYFLNGEEKELVGEIYSGAIYPSLERNDYLPLPKSDDESIHYTLCMTNELEEIQHTNLVELVAIDHDSTERVLIDKYGEPQTLSNITQSVTGVNLNGKNILDKIVQEDSLSYVSDEGLGGQNNDGIILTFKRPENVTNAKLVIKAKNTMWLDYVVLRFHELFGKKYDCWIEKQDKVSEQRMRNWVLNQNIPLSVYIGKRGKWKFVDYFNIVGPVAAKEDVLAFDLPDSESDSVRIKLESGNMFWEIDFVGIDFSKNQPVTKQLVRFDSGIDNYGIDVKPLLEVSDDQYYSQPEIGDAVTMKFILPEQKNARQSLFLHSQGYYIRKMNSEGEYFRNYLLTFRKKGKMTEFSNQLMQNQIHANTN
jgi:hypothetical protein